MFGTNDQALIVLAVGIEHLSLGRNAHKRPAITNADCSVMPIASSMMIANLKQLIFFLTSFWLVPLSIEICVTVVTSKYRNANIVNPIGGRQVRAANGKGSQIVT